MPGAYGLPVAAPRLVQVSPAATGTSSCSPTLPLTPQPGNILVAFHASAASGTSGASGGGIPGDGWFRYGHFAIASGTQCASSIWWGRVGPTPSASMSLSYGGSGGGFVCEVSNVLGIPLNQLAVAGSAAGGSATVTLSMPATTPGGLLFTIFVSRGNFTRVTPSMTVIGDFSNTARGRLLLAPNNGASQALLATGGTGIGGIGMVLT